MKIAISNRLALKDVPIELLGTLEERLSFINPKWIENDRLGYWNGKTPKVLKFYKVSDKGSLIIPRGFIRQLITLCKRERVSFHIEDQRCTLPEEGFQFQGTLRPFQAIACKEILSRDFGTLSAPTGSGKTVMALYLITHRKQPTLIVFHTKELLNQWISRIGTFLGIPAEQVGVIGNGKRTMGNRITVGLVQSLYKCAEEVAPHIGFLIVDECHRTPSRTFTECVTAFESRYMLGLSATPWRRDKLSRLIFWHLGDVVHKIEKEDLIETGDVLPAEVIIRETEFNTRLDPSKEYSQMLSELTQDTKRNLQIVNDVISETNNNHGISLVLSDRRAHCEVICQLLYVHGVRAELLTGQVSSKDREATIERLNEGLAKVVIATGQLIGEGFDCPDLQTLFLTTPIKFNGRVLQYLGRVLRPAAGKEMARVFDYVDSRVGVLRAAGQSRRRVYTSG